MKRLDPDSHFLLNVIYKERRSSQIVDRTIKKALKFFLVQIHGDYVLESGHDHHLSEKFARDGASLGNHFA